MARKISKKTRTIRSYLLQGVRNGRTDIVPDAVELFGISRQAIHRHLAALVEEGYLVKSGQTRARRYFLGPVREHIQSYLIDNLDEHIIHRRDFGFIFDGIPNPVEEICHYGFTEIVNNAIDHSEGNQIIISVLRDETQVIIQIVDDGEGIFERIARLMNLSDPRESLLELSKGKLTTDPDNHTGQGIFFTSRAFDTFQILSGDLVFSHHENQSEDYLLHGNNFKSGTGVIMQIALDSTKDLGAIFSEFSSGPDDYRFDRTVVPLKLALFEGERLVSRSQAKRILNRIERFTKVVLDFDDVDFIGQAFADEVFRVFALRHRNIEFIPINTNERVQQMINRAISDAMDFDALTNKT